MIDDPNVVLPLATSYNERGNLGYTHVVTNAEDQHKVNCIYEMTTNQVTGKGTLTLSKRPGVSKSTTTLGSISQVPYLIVANIIGATEVLFAMQGSTIFAIADTGTNTVYSSSAGTKFVPYLADTTGISTGPFLVLQVRANNTGPQRAFYANGAIGWREISDGDFTGLAHRGKMEHMDGYAFIMDSTNKILNSDIDQLQSWNPASFISKQIQYDVAQGLARYKNQLLAFGQFSAEVFYNGGNTSGSPLSRIPQLSEKVGLVQTSFLVNVSDGGTNYYAVTKEGLYFVGRTSGDTSSVGLYRYDGSRFEKVSSPYIDKILGEKTAIVGNVASSYYAIYKIGFNGQEGIAICFTPPGAAACNSLVFFPAWKEWFFWTSSVFSVANCDSLYIGTSGNPNRVYVFDGTDNWQDDGTSYQWLTQFKLPSTGSSRKRMSMYGVDADTDTSANTISVDVSDDDCASFYALPSLDLTRDRKMAFRGGSFRKRHIRLSATDARPKRIHNFLARIE